MGCVEPGNEEKMKRQPSRRVAAVVFHPFRARADGWLLRFLQLTVPPSSGGDGHVRSFVASLGFQDRFLLVVVRFAVFGRLEAVYHKHRGIDWRLREPFGSLLSICFLKQYRLCSWTDSGGHLVFCPFVSAPVADHP